MKPVLSYSEAVRKKDNLYASDALKLGVDIILSLKGTPYTNPMEWNNYLRMAAGKGVELQMCKVLKQNNIIELDFDQDNAPSTKIERNGVPISMRFDATVKEGGAFMTMNDTILPQGIKIEMNAGEPIEIKSINNKNSFDIQKYIDTKPRESYVYQLAIYMDALSKEQGHLFVSSIDGLNSFWFVCKKIGDQVYQCGETIADLKTEYAKFAKLWELRDKDIPDEIWKEETYKLPIEQINWANMSVSAITEVRNGRKVIGSEGKWHIDYSPWKNLIVEKQGATLGYTEEELGRIREITKGFSSKTKK